MIRWRRSQYSNHCKCVLEMLCILPGLSCVPLPLEISFFNYGRGRLILHILLSINWIMLNYQQELPCASMRDPMKFDMRALKLEVGRRIEVFAAVLLTVVESLLSNLTFHEGPPNCNCQEIEAYEGETTSFSSREYLALTSTTESRVAIARISAQDTTPGHALFPF